MILNLAAVSFPRILGSSRNTVVCVFICLFNVSSRAYLSLSAHPHIIDGKANQCSQIEHRKCNAQMSVFIPDTDDPALRFALIVNPKNQPHNHPMPPMSKASLETKAAYQKCIEAVTLTGATVQKVDLGVHISVLQ